MARDFQKVGVVGLGTMGAGIAEVFARNGLAVVAVEIDEDAVARGRGHVEASTGRAVARGKMSDAENQALLERIEFTTSMDALADADLVVEAVPEHLDLKRAIFGQLDKICQPGGDPGHQHVLAVGHRDRGGHQPSRQGRRHALLQPGAGDEAGRGGAQRGHRAGRRRRRRGVRAEARQERRHDRRPRRVHRQRAAVRLPQPRRVAVRVALRQPRGHRRGHAPRLRAADGPARAVRPDRSGHRLRDPRHDVQAGPRPAACAEPDLQADDHGRAAGP